MPAQAHCREKDSRQGHDLTSTETASVSIKLLHDHLAVHGVSGKSWAS